MSKKWQDRIDWMKKKLLSQSKYMARRGRPRRAQPGVISRTRRNPRAIIPVGFPQTQKMAMHYYYRADSLAPGLPNAHFVWNINSVRDPDRTGVGKQPALYDNMNAIYKNFRVYKADITCDFYNNNDQPIIASIIYQGQNDTDLSNALTYDPRALPKNQCRHKVLSGNHLDGCKATLKLTVPMSGKSFEGAKLLYDDKYQGSNAANPTNTLMASINLCTLTGASVSCIIAVAIKYYVIWENPYTAEQLTLD